MPRYKFTERDLRGLRTFLQQPTVATALAAAVPIKRFAPPAKQLDEVELPVAVESRDRPDGVPLNLILAAARKAAPSVSGLVVRGGRVVVSHRSAPTAKERKQLLKLLGDRNELGKLRRTPTPQLVGAADLERVLLDDATPDADWLRAFRRYAVEQLIKPERPA